MLTWEYVESIWPADNMCPYLGVQMERGVSNACRTSPTLDRIDPAKGYVEGNVQVISQMANAMKQDATPAQLVAFARAVLQQAAPMISAVA
jgi:hypothetical protein